MSVQRCASCMAPLQLRDEPPGAAIRCRFCGADNRTAPLPSPLLPRPAPPASEPPPPPAPVSSDAPAPSTDAPKPPSQPMGRAPLVAGAAVLAAVVGVVVWATRPLPLDRLSRTPDADEGWIRIDAPTPPGGYARFDPAAAVPWAQHIARAWARDAVLTYVNADALRRDGTADVVTESTEETSGPRVWYHFASPARIADYHRRAARSELKVNFDLQVQVQDGTVKVLRSLGTPGENVVPKEALPARLCPLSHAVAALLKERKIPERPAYSATLNAGSGYAWSVSTRDTHASGMVHADTCEVR